MSEGGLKEGGPENERMTRYLLGELSPEESEALEREYLLREGVFESLLMAEEALIDAYVAGRLSDPQRRRFEQRFQADPEGRERVEFARALRQRAGRPAAAPGIRANRVTRLALLAALVVAALGWTWSYRRTRALDQQLQDARSARVRLERDQQELRQAVEGQRQSLADLTEELARLRESRPALAAVSWLLDPGRLREGGGAPRRQVPSGAGHVQLRLRLERDTHSTYRAVLRTAEGGEIWREEGLRSRPRPDGPTVDLTVPARRLEAGTYVIVLTGSSVNRADDPVDIYHLYIAAPR
jgi:anti-sigma factor RsiW